MLLAIKIYTHAIYLKHEKITYTHLCKIIYKNCQTEYYKYMEGKFPKPAKQASCFQVILKNASN